MITRYDGAAAAALPPLPGYYRYHPSLLYERTPPRARVAVWDVICTVSAWVVLVFAAVTAAWLSLFFAFATDTCSGDCPPVPFGIDNWIYPVTWGGIGMALVIAATGTFVSLWRRWYMFIWPAVAIAIAIVILSFLAGFAVTAFSERYWR